MSKVTIRDVKFSQKRVLVRVDFNVPLDKDGRITDDARIKAAVPTIKYILEQGASKVILMSHLGRPDGQVVESLRMDPVAQRLAALLGEAVEKVDDCIGEKVKEKIAASDKRVVLLENLRFHIEEEEGGLSFSRSLAALADMYVNDAFGTAHRAHASTTIIAKSLPSSVGFLMEKEVNSLSCAVSAVKPYVVILGGAKVSDKIGVITNLMQKADKFIIGGAMAYTFLKSQGIDVGASKVEEDKLGLAKKILEDAKRKGVKIILPIDHLVVDDIDTPGIKKTQAVIAQGLIGVDVGQKSIELFKSELQTARTVLWNGPLGIFEKDAYARGTKELAVYLASLKNVKVIVGGGDSAAAAKKFGVADKLEHVSTGGGASLEFLEGKELPGIAVIPDK